MHLSFKLNFYSWDFFEITTYFYINSGSIFHKQQHSQQLQIVSNLCPGLHLTIVNPFYFDQLIALILVLALLYVSLWLPL